MKSKITYVRFVENKVRVSTKKDTSWKGKQEYNLSERQIKKVRDFIMYLDLKYLADLLNTPEKKRDGMLCVMSLLNAFSRNKSIETKADDTYADKISQKGIKEINRMLKNARTKDSSSTNRRNKKGVNK